MVYPRSGVGTVVGPRGRLPLRRGCEMAKTLNRLSAAAVKNAKPGMHCDGGGLYLQASRGTDGEIKKSWLFRFAANGRERQMGLGSVATVNLAEAREKARECRQLRQDGIDPIGARNAQRAAAAADSAKAMTFDECAERYIAAHRAGWRNPKHASQWQNTLATYVSRLWQVGRPRGRRRACHEGLGTDLDHET